jgi:hypothetical protein
MIDRSELYRRYLLGDLPEEEAQELERRFFDDEDELILLECAEWLPTSGSRDRLRVARLLAPHVGARPDGAGVHPGLLVAPGQVWEVAMSGMRGEGGRIRFELPHHQRTVRLLLQSDLLVGFVAYRVEVRDAAGEPVPVSRAELQERRGAVAASMPVASLSPGPHQVELTGIDATGAGLSLGIRVIMIDPPSDPIRPA